MPTTSAQTHTPRDLVRLAGRLPSFAAAAALACWTAVPAIAQPGGTPPPSGSQPAKPKDGEQPQVKVSDHMTVDLHVKDEDLGAVLELLSIQTQKNIIASKNVSARVTATLYNVTFDEALDALLHVNGFGYVKQGNFIYVYTQAEIDELQKMLKKRVAKPMRLNYLNAADAAVFVKPLISKDGELQMSAKATPFTISDKGPGGDESYALGATLVVFDYEENIAAVEALLVQLDTRPAQVLVEATVLQTALNEANAFGVDVSVLADLNFTDFLNTGGPRTVADALVKGGPGTSGQGVSPADNQGFAAQSTAGGTDGRSNFKIGVIADPVAVFVKLLDEVSDTVIISHPKVLALNRQASRVLVGRRVGYLNTTSTETSTTQTVEFLDTGTQLYFRPFVAKDNSIRMELKPQVSEAIIRDQTSTTGAAVSIPDEVTQEVVTNVIVKDGQTVVLGGLFREDNEFTRRQVPVLGDIPVVGAAFRGHDDTIARSEIIFMITPTLLNDSLASASASQITADIERLRAGARQSLLPFSREKMSSALNVEAEHLARDGQYEKALWTLQRSLSINPIQPDALQLREKITGERELWPSRSALQSALDDEIRSRLDRVHAPGTPQPRMVPDSQVGIPLEPAGAAAGKHSNAESIDDLMPASPEPNAEPAMQGTAPTPTTPPTPSAAATPADSSMPAGGDGDSAMPGPQSQPASSTDGSTTPASPDPRVSLDVQNEEINAVLNQLSEQTHRNIIAGRDVHAKVTAKFTNVSLNEALDSILHAYGFGYVKQGNFIYVYAQHEMESLQPTAMSARTAGPTMRDTQAAAAAGTQNPASWEQAAACRESVAQSLSMLSDKIALFRRVNNTWPSLGLDANTGWDPMISASLLQQPPANPWVEGPFATDVVLGSAPDTSYHADYGWIFNPETGQLWAAACDESGNPFPKTGGQPVAGAGQPVSPTAPLPWLGRLSPAGIAAAVQNMFSDLYSSGTDKPVAGVETEPK